MSQPYDIELGDRLKKELEKLEKKDKSVYSAIIKKMQVWFTENLTDIVRSSKRYGF